MQLGNLSQNLSTINFSELSKFIFKVLKYLTVKAHNEYNNEGTQFKGSICRIYRNLEKFQKLQGEGPL